MINEVFIAVGLLVGMLGLFRWLFRTVTGETIGWWDTTTFVFLGGLIRRVLRWATSPFEQIPQWIADWGGFAIYLLLMYWMLRAWKECTPKQSAIIITAWIPLVLIAVVAFLLANPGITE